MPVRLFHLFKIFFLVVYSDLVFICMKQGIAMKILYFIVLAFSATVHANCIVSDPPTQFELQAFRSVTIDGYQKSKKFLRSKIYKQQNRYYKTMYDAGFSHYEAIALQHYKIYGFSEMNSILYKDVKIDTPALAASCGANKLLFSALSRLPNYQGIVYRGLKLLLKKAPGNIDSVEVGGYWMTKSFMCTSKTEEAMSAFADGATVTISSHTCKNVSWNKYVDFLDEEEVICLPGTVFKINKNVIDPMDRERSLISAVETDYSDYVFWQIQNFLKQKLNTSQP